MKYFYTIISIFLLMSGCDLFEYHPYDGRLSGELNMNRRNIKIIEEQLKDRTDFKFAFLSDTQGWYDDTVDAVNKINSRGDIDFVIHGGDVTDYGLTKEFLWQRDMLNKLKMPYVVIIGNHDCLANGEEVFLQVFGENNYSFMVGNVKIVCLNTNALEHDYSRPVPDFQFIRKQNDPENEKHQKTIFAMHARPYSEQFNNNVADVFQDEIKKYPNLLFCLNGHDHNLKITDIFEDGILYFGVAAVHKRSYIEFTVTKDNYSYEVVEF